MTHTHLSGTHVCTHTHTCLCTRTHICARAHMCAHTHAHTCVCTHTRILILISESSDTDDPDWEPEQFSTPPEHTDTAFGPARRSAVALINQHTAAQL